MIHAKILLDSVSPAGHRLTTYELTYPRYIHAQLLTHRVFSRNAQSSRAERTEKLLNRMISQPVRPLEWNYAQKGMQPGERMSARHARACDLLWNQSMMAVLEHVRDLVNFNASKELINRLLEPYLTITTILTGTEFSNFFRLRCSDDTQKEMQVLANHMKETYEKSEPRPVAYGDYHMPFANALPDSLDEYDKLRCAVARCARVSYCAHDGSYSPEQDLQLYDRLLQSGHMSPFEHVAAAPLKGSTPGWRNLRGWTSWRQIIEDNLIGYTSRLGEKNES